MKQRHLSSIKVHDRDGTLTVLSAFSSDNYTKATQDVMYSKEDVLTVNHKTKIGCNTVPN
jgi:hypothetical protein